MHGVTVRNSCSKGSYKKGLQLSCPNQTFTVLSCTTLKRVSSMRCTYPRHSTNATQLLSWMLKRRRIVCNAVQDLASLEFELNLRTRGMRVKHLAIEAVGFWVIIKNSRLMAQWLIFYFYRIWLDDTNGPI